MLLINVRIIDNNTSNDCNHKKRNYVQSSFLANNYEKQMILRYNLIESFYSIYISLQHKRISILGYRKKAVFCLMKRFDSPDDLNDRGLVNASYVILMSGQSQGNATHANMSYNSIKSLKIRDRLCSFTTSKSPIAIITRARESHL